jgi:hypothetical protein
VIGPTFLPALQAAGLLGLPFAYDEAGNFSWGPGMTGAQINAVLAVYAAHNPAALTPQMQFDQLVAGGLTIVALGLPQFSGTYAIDDRARANITGVAAGLAAGFGLPSRYALIPIEDIGGTMHYFAGPQYLVFAAAVRDFYAAALLAFAAAAAGQPATWPNPVRTVSFPLVVVAEEPAAFELQSAAAADTSAAVETR